MVVTSNMAETLDMITDKVSSGSMTGLRYEDGGALGFVTIGNRRTKYDRLATLKINCEIDKATKMLIQKLECLQDGRPCTLTEHRHLLGSVKKSCAVGDDAAEISPNEIDNHGTLLRGKVLTDPEDQGDKYLDYNTKNSHLNILMTALRKTVILGQTETRRVFVSGSGAPGCGAPDAS